MKDIDLDSMSYINFDQCIPLSQNFQYIFWHLKCVRAPSVVSYHYNDFPPPYEEADPRRFLHRSSNPNDREHSELFRCEKPDLGPPENSRVSWRLTGVAIPRLKETREVSSTIRVKPSVRRVRGCAYTSQHDNSTKRRHVVDVKARPHRIISHLQLHL